MNQDALEKWMILELRQEIYKMSLEYLIVWESKKVLKTNEQQQQNKPHYNVVMSKGANWKNSQWPKLVKFEQENK